MNEKKWEIYNPLIQKLNEAFGDGLRTVVLFGSRARGETDPQRDHDIFLVIERLPVSPLIRQKEIRRAIWDIPLRINLISKTPEEVACNLTPLMLEICVDGVCLYGENYFEPYRIRAMEVLKQSGLKRKCIGKDWYWQFENLPRKEWEINWEGFRELS